VGDDARIPGPFRDLDGRERLGDGADLIQFDQYAVGDALGYALYYYFGLVTKISSPTILNLRAAPVGEFLPPNPVILGQAVFY